MSTGHPQVTLTVVDAHNPKGATQAPGTLTLGRLIGRWGA